MKKAMQSTVGGKSHGNMEDNTDSVLVGDIGAICMIIGFASLGLNILLTIFFGFSKAGLWLIILLIFVGFILINIEQHDKIKYLRYDYNDEERSA